MTITREAVLSVAVSSGKIAFVYLIGDDLKDWRCSRASTLSVTAARSFVRVATAKLGPDVLILENPTGSTRKGGMSRDILFALAQDIKDSNVAHVLIERRKTHANKYLEARDLAKRYPLIKGWLPDKPKIWFSEPINTVYFEALAMVEQYRSVHN